MASSGNFATINFQAQSLKSTVTPTLGNLKFDGSTLSPGNYEGGIVCNFGMKSGKWYWETYLSGGGTPNNGRDWNVGFAPYSTASKSIDEGTYGLHLGNGSSSTLSGYGYTQYPAGTMGIRHNNSTSSFGSAHSSGDILGHALDLDNGTWIIYKNGSSLGTAATGIDTSFTYFAAGGVQGGTISSFDVTWNFGQDSTFGGAVSAGGNSDGNGFGDFKYSVPSGYLACSTANLSISDDIDPAQTDDDYVGGKQFEATAYSGTGSSHNISLGFKPDLVWIKERGATGDHKLTDSTRGVTKSLESNTTNTEATDTNGLTAFGSDGFTVGSDGAYNNSSDTYVSWAWRANGGVTSSNTDGALTCTLQANQPAGFSISKYTANGTGQSFGHGLGKVPAFFIVKKIDNQARRAVVWHQSLSSATQSYLILTQTNADTTDTLWNNTAPTSSTISVQKDTTEVNSPSGDSFVCWAWSEIEGFSKFSKYEGNGNADGPFIYTGFRPKMIFIKSIDGASGDWIVIDTARSTFNVTNAGLSWNADYSETTSNRECDILSNGFKLRTSNTNLNKASETYIFGAWGDVPFKYNNTF